VVIYNVWFHLLTSGTTTTQWKPDL